jgi:hypothetical protein
VDHFDRIEGNAQFEQPYAELLLRIRRAGERLLDQLQDVQKSKSVGVIAQHLSFGRFIDVVDLMLGAEFRQPLLSPKE